MKKYNLIIIGGGPAGLMLRNIVKDSLLIEKKSECGLKLLITGNGSSNITHNGTPGETALHYYDKKHFVSPSLYAFPPSDIMDFFDKRGVPLSIREDDRVFPSSGKSRDIRDALLGDGENIIYNTSVKKVGKEDETFVVETDNGTYYSEYIALSTGGMSYTETGSDGSGYTILKALGHRIIPPSPALVSLKCGINTEDIEGVAVKNCTLKKGNISYTGAILFTKDGITGPAALNISRYYDKEDDLTVRFLDNFSPGDIKKMNGKKNALNALSSLTTLPESLLSFLFPSIREKNTASLSKNDLNKITSTLLSWIIRAKAGGMKRAMVTRGGVDTAYINKKTMESKIVENLYAIGEVLDADGECGGYNLTFALGSAVLAGNDINRKNKIKHTIIPR